MTNREKLKSAVTKGDINTVREFLSRKLTCDTLKDGRTLLHVASQNGRLEVVELLLQSGSNIEARDVNGYTPLQLSSARGYLEVIKILLESGAHVDHQDQCGNTAVHMAAWNGFSQSVEMLIQFHANVNISNKVGFTALHTAAQKGHNQSARVLIYAGAFLDAKNKYGETPLQTSTRHGHAGVAQILISAKAKLDSRNREGETCLHVAASLKRNKIARLLVEGGAKKSLKNKKGETPLDVAKKNNSIEISELLRNYIGSEEKRKKVLGLFNFLRRKNVANEQHVPIDPILPSSTSSSKNHDSQNLDLSRAESFKEIRMPQAVNSLDRLQNKRQLRNNPTFHQRQQVRQTKENAGQSTNLNSPTNQNVTAYDMYNPYDIGRAMAYGDYMNCCQHSGLGAYSCCPNSLFVPGYSGIFGGIPHHPLGLQYGPNLLHGLTHSIDQNMQYYRDLAGNLKHISRPVYPTRSNLLVNREKELVQGRLDLEDYAYEFDIDADSYIYRGQQIPQQHFYEPIGSHGLHSPHSDNEGGVMGRQRHPRASRLSQTQPGQHHLSGPTSDHPDINGNVIPLEPRVLIMNSDTSRTRNNGDKDRNFYRNVALELPSPYSLQGGENVGLKESRKPLRTDKSHPTQIEPLRRCISDETISTVMGSSNARRKAYAQRSSYSKNQQMEDRLRNARINRDESEVEMPRFKAKRSSAWDNRHRTSNKKREKHAKKRESRDLDEDYLSSENSLQETCRQANYNLSIDKSFSSSASNGEFPKDDDVAPEDGFHLEIFEESPGKKYSHTRGTNAVDTLESRSGANFYPSANIASFQALEMSTNEEVLKNALCKKSQTYNNSSSQQNPISLNRELSIFTTQSCNESSNTRSPDIESCGQVAGSSPNVDRVTSV